MAAPKKKSNTMAAFRRGYVKGRTEARDKAVHVVDAIVMDIDARSGLSPMLWCDKEQRNKIINTWVEKAEEVLE